MNQNKEYAFRVKLNLPYEQAVQKAIESLKEQGFGVMTEIDVQAILKQKLDVNFRKYIILGTCNPSLGHRALSTELEIGLLFPCNVIVYEADGGSFVSIQDPIAMMSVANNPDLEPIAREAREHLQRVIAALSE